VGTDAIPPRAGGLPTRLVLGPALRAQSDRRLVRLVREGYEGAFDEIVRRYRRPLGRFAASIVGGRHEDVTQDSFRKALEALRRGDAEIELRPWLYRIVRNTALNDLRDRPPAAAELADDLVAGTRSAAAEAEAREEVAELVEHLRALPENQRAALLMRELDGMGHDEIGAALGISKGAARQAIARGRAAVRSGFGALLPLPWLRSLLDGGAPVEAGVGTGALAGAGATAIGAGGAGALKIGLATVVVAGSLGAGVAIDHGGAGHHISQRRGPVAVDPARAAVPQSAFAVGRNHYGELRTPSGASAQDVADDTGADDRSHGRGGEDGDDRRGGEDRRRDHGGDEDDRHGSTVVTDGSHSGEDRGRDDEDVNRSGGGPGPSSSGKDSSEDSGSHSGDGGGRDDGTSRGSSGHGGSGHGSGGGDDPTSGGGGRGGGSGSGDDSHSGGGHGSDDDGESTPVETTASTSVQESSSGGRGPSSSSSGGSGSSDSSSGSDDSVAVPTSGSTGGESIAPIEPPVAVDDSPDSGGGGSSGGPGPSGDSEIHP
jgi:RNA polymerase sigma factor (sigma-70 family)